MASATAKVIPINIIKFAIKKPINSICPSVNPDNYLGSFVRNVAVGGIVGAVPMLITYPFGFSFFLVASDVGVDGTRLFKGHRDCLDKVIK